MAGTAFLLFVFGVMFLVNLNAENSPSPDAAKPAAERFVQPAQPSVTGIPVEMADFRFVMPGEPELEIFEEGVLGIQMTGTAWTIEKSDSAVQVLAIQIPAGFEQAAADGSFDAQLGGIARRAGGTLIVNEPINNGDEIVGRRGEVEFPDGRIFTEMYAQGEWIVAISGGGAGTQAPPGYASLLTSFTWLP